VKILDVLSEDEDKRIESFRKIWETKPNFFKQSSELLKIPITHNFMSFTWELDPSEIGDFVNGDWKIGKNSSFFEVLLSGDTYELWDRHFYDGDWESALDYHVDTPHENAIKEHLMGKLKSLNVDLDTIDDMSLQDLITEYDGEDEVIDALRRSLEECEMESYYSHVHSLLKDALEDYGDVEQLNYDGAKIKINLSEVLNNVFNGDMDELYEWFDEKGFDLDEYDGILREVFLDDPYGDRPEFSLDDRWYPDVNHEDFNKNLTHYFGEFMDDDIIKKL